MTESDEPILLERRGAVCVLTLDRPATLNAANRELHRSLAGIWDVAAADDSTRAIVLTGSGRAFCAGGDAGLLADMVEDEGLRREVLDEGGAIVRAMIDCPLPIVAAINGPAVGLGWSLASSCDHVIVADDTFFADPHVTIGLVAGDGGALTLPLVTGLLRAKEFVLLGDRLPAADAVRLHVANRAVPRDEVLAAAIAVAERFAALPRQAVAETKRVLNLGLSHAVDRGLDDALAAEAASFLTDDFQRNLAALLDR